MSEKVFCDCCGTEIKDTLTQIVSQRCSITIRKGGEQMLAKDACSSCAEQIRRVLTLGHPVPNFAQELAPILDNLTVR